MWILIHDCFFSIVHKDCAADEHVVRARRKGDIEKLWPDAKVIKLTNADYLFRAVIKKADIIKALSTEIEDIEYDNFKNSVKDDRLHDAYATTWASLATLQPTRPYSGYKRLR